MNSIYILIILFIVYILYTTYESYENISDYDIYKLKYKVKDDEYMNFLGNLNDSFKKYLQEATKGSSTPIRQKILCDDKIRQQVQSKALIDAFKTVKEKNIDYDSNLFDKNIPPYSKIPFSIEDENQVCRNKASQLCERTDPLLYLSQNTNFPPRWLFKTYKNVPLPKHTDLKCWSNMLNCCKTNF
jgi:hypothetical protein